MVSMAGKLRQRRWVRPVLGLDVNGQPSYGDAYEVPCRVEPDERIVTSTVTRREEAVTDLVYTEDRLPTGGLVFPEGDDGSDVRTGQVIHQSKVIPSLRNTQTVCLAHLGAPSLIIEPIPPQPPSLFASALLDYEANDFVAPGNVLPNRGVLGTTYNLEASAAIGLEQSPWGVALRSFSSVGIIHTTEEIALPTTGITMAVLFRRISAMAHGRVFAFDVSGTPRIGLSGNVNMSVRVTSTGLLAEGLVTVSEWHIFLWRLQPSSGNWSLNAGAASGSHNSLPADPTFQGLSLLDRLNSPGNQAANTSIQRATVFGSDVSIPDVNAAFIEEYGTQPHWGPP